jgi:hypothetical protein
VANKRDTSRQKRARQNRAQRDALKARTEAASVPPTERQAKATASTTEPAKGTKGASARGPRKERPPRPGDRPVDIATLEGNWFSKRMQVPGGRQVLTGALLTLVITGLMLVWKFPNPDARYFEASVRAVNELTGTDLTVVPAEDYPANESVWQVWGTAAWAALGVPLAAMLISAWAILRSYRRRVWIGASFIVALTVFSGFIMYLFPVGFLTFAVWRAAKVEGPMRAPRQPAPVEPDEV